MLHEIYGNKIQETGHRTEGHLCVTDEDRHLARHKKGSLLYGELLPRGVNKALDSRHLDSRSGESVFDLGMGTGKVVLQVFLQCLHLKYVYGAELSLARYRVAETAALKMVELGNRRHMKKAPQKVGDPVFADRSCAARAEITSVDSVLDGDVDGHCYERRQPPRLSRSLVENAPPPRSPSGNPEVIPSGTKRAPSQSLLQQSHSSSKRSGGTCAPTEWRYVDAENKGYSPTPSLCVRFEVVEHVRDKSLRIWDRSQMDPGTGKPRELHLEWLNLLETKQLNVADFVFLETDIPTDSMLPLACLL